MKKIFVYMASAALMFAVSCNKEEVNVDTTAPVETELITVDLNPMTKTALGAEGTTTWDADDKVSVTVGGKVVGTLSLVEGSTFSGEITAGLSGAAVLNYPAGVTTVPATQTAVAGSFADGAALLEGTTTVEDLRAGTGVELQNKTALLMFTVAQAGDVTFEVGTAKYTVTGCKTGATYYACVAPASNVNFTARIDGCLSKESSKTPTFAANKIFDLGTLPEPVIRLYVKSEYTHFDMNVYAWGINGVSLPSTWPGSAMKWDKNRSLYYYDFPYGIKGKKLNYIVNNGVYQTADLDVTINSPEHIDNSNVNWHWLYFKPSNNWKEANAWFAACFDPDGVSYWMRSIGPDTNGVYGFVQPSGITIVEFTRMNPAKDELSWSNKWNSTAQQTIPTNGNNYFQCTEGWWDAHNGGWTKYTLPNQSDFTRIQA